jgi:hypothetical protein
MKTLIQTLFHRISTCAGDLKIFQILDTLADSQSLREPHDALPPEVSMSNYEIQIHIQIRPTDDDVTEESQQDGDGRFRTVVSGATGQSIDACEQALLGLNYPALR